MKSLVRMAVVLGICLFFTSSFLLAQARMTGAIEGTVVDESGLALPGVSITLTGEKLFQAELAVLSNEQGRFRFISLNPGSYDLSFSVDGFKTLVLRDVEVEVGRTTPVKAELSIADIQESIEVVEEIPLIETKTTQISTNYTTELVQNIPTSRSLLDLMEATPAINDRGAYGAGGNADAAYYKGSSTSAYLFNGVDISDQDSGATWVSPNYDTIEEIQVVGVGASAEYGNFSGAVVNVITKRGSNEIHGGLNLYFMNSSLQGDNSGGIADLQPDDIKYHPDMSFQIGGPLIKEKLFFFTAGGYTVLKSMGAAEPEYNLLKQPHYQARLDWLPGPKHSFSFMLNSDPLDHSNLGLRAGSGPEIAYNRVFRSTAMHADWQYVPSSNTIVNLKYSGFVGEDATDPVSPNTMSITDNSVNRVYGSSGMVISNERSRHQANLNITHYADDFLGSSHEFKFGLEYEFSKAVNNTDATGADNTLAMIVPYGPVFFVYGFEGYSIHTESNVSRMAAFVQDDVKIGNRLALNLGLRFDGSRLTTDGSSEPVVELNNLAPRVGLSFDINGDGRNVFHAHYGRYFDKTVTGGFLYALPGVQDIGLYATFLFQAFNPTDENIQNLTNTLFQPGNLMFTIKGTEPLPVDSGLSSPYTDVINFGFEKELWGTFAFAIDYIYKRDRNALRIGNKTEHSYIPVEYTDPYLNKTVTLYDQIDYLPDEYYYTNSDWAKRRHHLLILSLKKRFANRWSLSTSFVYQNSEGNDDNSLGPVSVFARGQDTDPNFTENPYIWGKLTYNRSYQFKVLGIYQLPWGINVSGDLRILSGLAWSPSVSLAMTGIYRETTYNVLMEERGSRVFPTSCVLNLRLSKEFSLSETSRIEVIADVLNALNRDNASVYYTGLGSVYPISGEDAFGLPAGLDPPRQVRLGLRWAF